MTQRSDSSIVARASVADWTLSSNSGEPCPPALRRVEGQELIAAGDRRGAGQQEVLDVVELEHPRYCIWSSMVENAAFSRSAFLISSAVTYGYSPYSRKLGTW